MCQSDPAIGQLDNWSIPGPRVLDPFHGQANPESGKSDFKLDRA